MIKDIDGKTIKQELKETKKRIDEIEKKELRALRKKVSSMKSLLNVKFLSRGGVKGTLKFKEK